MISFKSGLKNGIFNDRPLKIRIAPKTRAKIGKAL
jgi:hypothetical protein